MTTSDTTQLGLLVERTNLLPIGKTTAFIFSLSTSLYKFINQYMALKFPRVTIKNHCTWKRRMVRVEGDSNVVAGGDGS